MGGGGTLRQMRDIDLVACVLTIVGRSKRALSLVFMAVNNLGGGKSKNNWRDEEWLKR